MGLFDKVLGSGSRDSKNVDLSEIIEGEGDVISPPADFYIKKIDLRNEGDVDLVVKELTDKNVIIMNVLPLSKQPNRLKALISKLKEYSNKVDGDIALLSPEMIILTPPHVKIVKSKGAVKKTPGIPPSK